MVELANGWTLRPRQEECHDKLIQSYLNGEKDFFIAAVCRFGKTITTTSTLRDLGNIVDQDNQVILILCTMNIKSEWFDGAEKAGLDTSLIGNNKDDLVDINSIDFDNLSRNGKHIVYVSTQKLGNNSVVSEQIIEWFNQHKGLKTLVYDECHLGACTERTRNVVDRLDYDNRVYLSGTPYRKYLKNEFNLDKAVGEATSYKYTLTDEKKDYKEGLITDYTPVQLQMHILDYKNTMDNLIPEDDSDFQKYKSISSTYFKKIFSDAEYQHRGIEFLNKIIEFSEQHTIKNWLFFVPLQKVGNDIVKNFSRLFKDKIEFLNLSGEYSAGEDENNAWEQSVVGLNNLYDTKNCDGRLKVGLTCNKCGTGSTMKNLDAVAFLKDTSQAISFIQKSQRPRTPVSGKSVGYVLCFNSFEGLEAYKNYVVAETETNDDEADRQRKFKDKYEEFKNNGVIELYLDLKKIDNYEDLIDIENTYIPGKYPLFDDFEFDLFDTDDLVFLTSVDKLKKSFQGKKYGDLRSDADFQNAQTPQDLQKVLRKHGLNDEAEDIESSISILDSEQKRQLLELYYVSAIRTFFEWNKSSDDVTNTNSYNEAEWTALELQFGSRRIWKHILSEYPRYVGMVYNFLRKGF